MHDPFANDPKINFLPGPSPSVERFSITGKRNYPEINTFPNSRVFTRYSRYAGIISPGNRNTRVFPIEYHYLTNTL